MRNRLFVKALLLALVSCGKVRDDGSADSASSGGPPPDANPIVDTAATEGGPDVGSGESGYRADGCPVYLPCNTPCTSVDVGRNCWYHYQCDTPLGSIQECVCELVTKPESGYMWRPKKFCDCPKDASPEAIYD